MGFDIIPWSANALGSRDAVHCLPVTISVGIFGQPPPSNDNFGLEGVGVGNILGLLSPCASAARCGWNGTEQKDKH